MMPEESTELSEPSAASQELTEPPIKEIVWLSTAVAARRLGVTTRTLYRFIDRGDLVAYRFGRVIRLQLDDLDTFLERSRVEPGSLEHLYPETRPADLDEAVVTYDTDE